MIKAITIRDAQLTDITKFNEYKDRNPGTTSGGVFNKLCLALTDDGKLVNHTPSNENLDEKTNELNQMLNDLQQVNIKLSNEIEQLKAKQPETITTEIEKPLTGTQFVFEPSKELFTKMHRSITYMITKGKLNRSSKNLPDQFTALAIEYFIKNEFNHILK